jgi:hypothetical protein
MTEDDETPVRRRWPWALAILFLALTLAWAMLGHSSAEIGLPASALEVFTPPARAPAGVRIRVEILNATATRGLALTATRLLRDRGFDVVSIGNAPVQRDSTLVLDRTSHPQWARLASEALGRGRVALRPDSSGYVDITVLLGSDWTPPAKTIYP